MLKIRRDIEVTLSRLYFERRASDWSGCVARGANRGFAAGVALARNRIRTDAYQTVSSRNAPPGGRPRKEAHTRICAAIHGSVSTPGQRADQRRPQAARTHARPFPLRHVSHHDQFARPARRTAHRSHPALRPSSVSEPCRCGPAWCGARPFRRPSRWGPCSRSSARRNSRSRHVPALSRWNHLACGAEVESVGESLNRSHTRPNSRRRSRTILSVGEGLCSRCRGWPSPWPRNQEAAEKTLLRKHISQAFARA